MKFGVEVQEGLTSPFQQKKKKKKDLHECFTYSVWTPQTLIYLFQILRDKDPFLRDSHTYHLCSDINTYICQCLPSYVFLHSLKYI